MRLGIYGEIGGLDLGFGTEGLGLGFTVFDVAQWQRCLDLQCRVECIVAFGGVWVWGLSVGFRLWDLSVGGSMM